MKHVPMRRNNWSPPLAENPASPSILAGPSVSTSNGREFDAEGPTRPSSSLRTANHQHADISQLSNRPSLRSKPSDLGFEPQRSKPWFRGFEKPSFSRVAILTGLCLIVYPAFYILTLLAKDRSLFMVRTIVSVWCSGVGFALGYILLKIGAQHLEAASEFTLAGYCGVLRLDFEQPGPL